MKRKVLLYGPSLNGGKKSYGGGVGGYTRNMKVYVDTLKPEEIDIIPCFHTVRGQLFLDNFAVRFIYDMCYYLYKIITVRPDIVHILAQYRSAIPREYAVVRMAKLFGIKVLYEVKAGALIPWQVSTGNLNKRLIEYCIVRSDKVLVEGIPYIDFIKDTYNKEAHYFPNFVPDSEIQSEVSSLFVDDNLKILFVGYCYKGKGIFELLDACIKVAEYHKVTLRIIGQEHEDFTKYLDTLKIPQSLNLIREGKKKHSEVLVAFNESDIYCYPTSHSGEGHNNTINEAMMLGRVIVTTKQGFLGSVLSDDTAYFLDDISVLSIVNTIRHIADHKSEAFRKGEKARQYLMDNFRSSVAFKKLITHYNQMIS